MAGSVAYSDLPVASLPNVDFPVIGISANLPGASPETMASSVATPLERQFGRIAGVNQMTSSSSLGASSVTLQFDIDRNIDAAARDVQASINAARSQLPANLPQNPGTARPIPPKRPSSSSRSPRTWCPSRQIYDMADSILAQKISQIQGVGQCFVGGSAQPAVRVEVNPMQLGTNGIGLEAVRTALGERQRQPSQRRIQDPAHRWQIDDNDQMFKASDYAPIIAGYNPQTGAPVRMSDLGSVVDSVADIHTAGLSGTNPDFGTPCKLKDAILIMVFKVPGANVIATVDAVMAELPRLQAAIPPTIELNVAVDRTTTIRSSVHDVEISLLISVLLVVLVVFLFLREVWATIIPSIAVPLSLLGTFGVMYLVGYTIDNLSLMALTISTGFVVDDAIVVIENITRYLEDRHEPVRAAMKGSREIGFTVLSMSTSLIAVFIPILLMGGLVGKLFREFAVTLSVAIAVSLLVSLTTTPMLCAQFLKSRDERRHGRHLSRQRARLPMAAQRIRSRPALGAAPPVPDARGGPRHRRPQRLSLQNRAQGLLPAAGHRPPQRPHRRRAGHQLRRHDATSSSSSRRWCWTILPSIPLLHSRAAPAPAAAAPTWAACSSRSSRSAIAPGASPPTCRQPPARKLTSVPGATTLSAGAAGLPDRRARQRRAVPVHALATKTSNELNNWAPQMRGALRWPCPSCATSPPTSRTRAWPPSWSSIAIPPRGWASPPRPSTRCSTTPSASAKSPPCTPALNQYYVVMEVDPRYQLSPDSLNGIFYQAANAPRAPTALPATDTTRRLPRRSTPSSGGAMVPLSAIAHYEARRTALAGESPGPVPGGHAHLQSRARTWPSATRSRRLKKRSAKWACPAASTPLSGHRAGLSGFAAQRALSDSRRAGRGLHRARHSV